METNKKVTYLCKKTYIEQGKFIFLKDKMYVGIWDDAQDDFMTYREFNSFGDALEFASKYDYSNIKSGVVKFDTNSLFTKGFASEFDIVDGKTDLKAMQELMPKNKGVSESIPYDNNKDEVYNGYVVRKSDTSDNYFVYDNNGHVEDDEHKGQGYATKEEAIERANSLEKGIAKKDISESMVSEGKNKVSMPYDKLTYEQQQLADYVFDNYWK
jgi:hypothetical protein